MKNTKSINSNINLSPNYIVGFIDSLIVIILSFFLVFISFFDFTNLFVVYCDSNCTDLVVWGEPLYSNVGHPKFTKLVSFIIQLPPFYKGVIIGLLLSDGWLNFSNKASLNARLGFQQSLFHFPYFWSVFTILSHYCFSMPFLRSSNRKGITSFGLVFQTRALPCFTELHSIFYVKGVKIVPADIFDLLTPIALAH